MFWPAVTISYVKHLCVLTVWNFFYDDCPKNPLQLLVHNFLSVLVGEMFNFLTLKFLALRGKMEEELCHSSSLSIDWATRVVSYSSNKQTAEM